MSKTGGSGTAAQHKSDTRLLSPSFNWRVLLPLLALGLVLALHLIIPAHENYRLKLLPYFSDFLVILLFVYGVAAAGTTAIFWNCGLKFYASCILRERFRILSIRRKLTLGGESIFLEENYGKVI
jgi:hypothetical protein